MKSTLNDVKKERAPKKTGGNSGKGTYAGGTTIDNSLKGGNKRACAEGK